MPSLVKLQPADLKQHICIFLIEQSVDQENGEQDRKRENAISGTVF